MGRFLCSPDPPDLQGVLQRVPEGELLYKGSTSTQHSRLLITSNNLLYQLYYTLQSVQQSRYVFKFRIYYQTNATKNTMRFISTYLVVGEERFGNM
jgi:hypothetical protein